VLFPWEKLIFVFILKSEAAFLPFPKSALALITWGIGMWVLDDVSLARSKEKR